MATHNTGPEVDEDTASTLRMTRSGAMLLLNEEIPDNAGETKLTRICPRGGDFADPLFHTGLKPGEAIASSQKIDAVVPRRGSRRQARARNTLRRLANSPERIYLSVAAPAAPRSAASRPHRRRSRRNAIYAHASTTTATSKVSSRDLADAQSGPGILVKDLPRGTPSSVRALLLCSRALCEGTTRCPDFCRITSRP